MLTANTNALPLLNYANKKNTPTENEAAIRRDIEKLAEKLFNSGARSIVIGAVTSEGNYTGIMTTGDIENDVGTATAFMMEQINSQFLKAYRLD